MDELQYNIKMAREISRNLEAQLDEIDRKIWETRAQRVEAQARIRELDAPTVLR
jgi:peptidoglycan hydrolase CwlO-like protein